MIPLSYAAETESAKAKTNYQVRRGNDHRCMTAVQQRNALNSHAIFEAAARPNTALPTWYNAMLENGKFRAADLVISNEESEMLLGSSRFTELPKKCQDKIKGNKRNWKKLNRTVILLYQDKESKYCICASIQSSSYASFGICLMGIDTVVKNWLPSYQLPKTPAVNPKTKQPWISISSEKVKDILSECGGKLSKEEIAYVKQLQYILNDNIHYFYGEQFVDLFGMSETERYKLSGRYAPVKLLMFDAFDSILPAEATQRRELSRYLGRPIYQLHKAWDIEKTAWEFPSSGAISTYITKRLVLKDGQKLGTVWYTASLRATYIDPNHGLRLGQLGYVHVSLG